MKASIGDVALKAGVSNATVSRTLRTLSRYPKQLASKCRPQPMR